MGETVTIAASDPVKRLLGIAKRHLGYIERARSKGIYLSIGGSPPVKLDHAIVASIFSAAAVEAGLNLFITLPVLRIEDENIRRFFGSLVTRRLRLSVPQKLDFVCEFSPSIKGDKDLLRRVKELFEYRNKILHSPPEYVEPLGFPDPENLPEEGWFRMEEKDLVRHPALSIRGPASDELEAAFEHYQTAHDFLNQLDVKSILIPQTRGTL